MTGPAARLPRLWRTTSLRFAALYVALFAASTVLLGGVVFWIARDALTHQMRARILAETESLRAERRTAGPAALARAVRRDGRGAGALDYRVQAADGSRIAGELPRLPPRAGWTILARPTGQAERETEQRGENPERLLVLMTPLDAGSWLAVGDDLGRISEVQDAILAAFAWALGLVVLLGGGGGILLSRAFLHRVDTIGRTAEAIIAGDLSRRIPERGTGDDLDRLAGTLNRMLDRIGALMESLRQVSADVAHDLRTPMARLMQQLDTARTHATTLAAYREAVDAAVAETESILASFAALLRIAQVEGGSRRAAFREVDLSALTASVAETYAPSIEAADHRFVVAIAPGLRIEGDAPLLTQMLANLLDNALRHTPAGTTIRLGLGLEHGRAVLRLADDGPGVAAAERGRILERFYRTERSRSTPGSGLGLTLVAAVAELHDAGLTVADAAPGLAVVVAFPPAPRMR